jgi:hypothetical protein
VTAGPLDATVMLEGDEREIHPNARRPALAEIRSPA